MTGIRFALAAVIILGALLILEFSDLGSWGRHSHPGDQNVPGPPEWAGTQAQSNTTLTHGAEFDRPVRKEAEAALLRPRGDLEKSEDLGRREFRRHLQTILEGLPTKKSFAAQPQGDVHGTPPAVLDAGVRLGEIAESLERTPSLRPEALEFYKNCALGPDIFRSIRALCFSRAQLLNVELHQDIWDYDQTRIPAEVVELAKSL